MSWSVLFRIFSLLLRYSLPDLFQARAGRPTERLQFHRYLAIQTLEPTQDEIFGLITLFVRENEE
ncbi:TPA: hypothetical protein DCE37_20740 [Candidatus Latescibacteria bacterium]|nr:hypothetical protein [Gemmatimonadota bacterium]HAA77547.1 hypothetical protein [Candidatus Latescibacterota bacterium]